MGEAQVGLMPKWYGYCITPLVTPPPGERPVGGLATSGRPWLGLGLGRGLRSVQTCARIAEGRVPGLWSPGRGPGRTWEGSRAQHLQGNPNTADVRVPGGLHGTYGAGVCHIVLPVSLRFSLGWMRLAFCWESDSGWKRLVGKIGAARWWRDCCEDGDVERNPGPASGPCGDGWQPPLWPGFPDWLLPGHVLVMGASGCAGFGRSSVVYRWVCRECAAHFHTRAPLPPSSHECWRAWAAPLSDFCDRCGGRGPLCDCRGDLLRCGACFNPRSECRCLLHSGGRCSHCTHMATSCTCGRALRAGEEGEWLRDLTSDGDVEANPGPPKAASPVAPCVSAQVVPSVEGGSAGCGDAQLVSDLFGLACPGEGEAAEALQVMDDAVRGAASSGERGCPAERHGTRRVRPQEAPYALPRYACPLCPGRSWAQRQQLQQHLEASHTTKGEVVPDEVLRALKKWACCGRLVADTKECPVCKRRAMELDLAGQVGSVPVRLGEGLWAPHLLLPVEDYQHFLRHNLGVSRTLPHGVEDLWAGALAEQIQQFNQHPSVEAWHHLECFVRVVLAPLRRGGGEETCETDGGGREREDTAMARRSIRASDA